MGYAEQEAETPKLLAEIKRLKNLIKELTQDPMTVEEMVARWPELPPFDARSIYIYENDPIDVLCPKRKTMDINQNTIDEIIEYFQACKETMNG